MSSVFPLALSNKRAIVCTFFQLPPEQQSLCVLTDIVAMFPPPLDYLNLAMAAVDERAYRPPYGSGMKSGIDDLRKKTIQICLNFMNVITLTKNFMDSSLQLVDLLASSSPKEQVLQHMSTIVSDAEANAKLVDKAQRETKSFSSAVSYTERHLQTKAQSSYVYDVSSEGVANIFTDWTTVLEVCEKVLHELAEYYREAKQHYSHPGILECNPPSKEEINMVRERWLSLSKGLLSMTKVLNRAHRRLEKSPDARRYDRVPPSWKDSPGSLDSESEPEEEPPVKKRWRKKAASLKSTSSTSSSRKSSESGSGRAGLFFSGLKSRFFSGRGGS